MKTEFEIQIFQEKSLEVESFIEENGSLFQQYDFLACVGENYRCILAMHKASGEIAALLPLVKTKKFGLKSYHIPFFTYQFGPVFASKYLNKIDELLTVLLKGLQMQKHLDFKVKIPDANLIPYKQSGFTVLAAQTHIIPPSISYNENFLTKNKQRDLKKLKNALEANKIKIYENDVRALEMLIDLQRETANRKKFNFHLDALENIFKYYSNNPDKCYINCITDENNIPVAGAFCPVDKTTAYHLIGASRRVNDKLINNANLLSLFRAISFANSRGLEFDFEGSNIPGVAQFYRMMGGQPKVIYRMQKTKSLYYSILRAIKLYREESL